MNDYPAHATLVGDYKCRITSAQCNTWREYCMNSPAYINYCDLMDRLNILKLRQAATPEDLTTELERAITEKRVAEDVMYINAKRWYEDNCAEAAEKESK